MYELVGVGKEFRIGARAQFIEVHALALHYHWSEGEILGLDVRRRRRYLELLTDAGDTDWGLV